MTVLHRIGNLSLGNVLIGNDGIGPFSLKSLKSRWSEEKVAAKPPAGETQHVPGYTR